MTETPDIVDRLRHMAAMLRANVAHGFDEDGCKLYFHRRERLAKQAALLIEAADELDRREREVTDLIEMGDR